MSERQHERDEHELAALELQCREAVDKFIARYAWRLLEPDEFARRTFAHVCSGVAADASRAAVYAYSHVLHHACSGAEGDERQNDAYTELFQYLYNVAAASHPTVRDDATQRALEAIFTSFGRCRQPGAFLAFALQHLNDAVKALRRQEQRQPQSLAPSAGRGEQAPGELITDPGGPDPAMKVLHDERRAYLRHCAARFVGEHPCASQQMEALWLKFIDGLDDITISRKLGRSIASVYVLRSRAINKLQADPKWRALAAEYDIVWSHV